MQYGTVDLIEVIWTLAALPGVVIWAINRAAAGRSLRAVRAQGIGNGRLVVARYSVFKSNVFIALSLVFVLIGAISMVRPANPEVAEWDWIRVVLTAGLLGAPALISLLGWRWRRVEQEIIALARARHTPRNGS